MDKKTAFRFALSIVMIAYLVVALSFTSHMAAADTCAGLYINVVDSTKRTFVSSDDIALELGVMGDDIRNVRFDSIDLRKIEQLIMAKDNIEHVNAQILNNRTLRIDVTPLIPMARVFDASGDSYYINRAGKHMRPSLQYRMDVPVVVGRFDGRITPQMSFNLLDYLDKNPDLANITSAIEIQRDGDLILVPKIRGHVVNLGDDQDLENKFRRLKVFYRKVMPVKGWEFYDTISVKWRGQIVASKRNPNARPQSIPTEEHLDLDDEDTMLAIHN